MPDRITTSNFDFTQLNRRQALLGLTGASALLLSNPEPMLAQNLACVLSPVMTEGPYWVDDKLNRSDVRVDPSDNTTRAGTPLSLTINVYDILGTGCSQLSGALVDIWHCDAAGVYSDVAANNTVGKKFLRGYQTTNTAGQVNFTTVYPGWYSGRAIHIHVRVRTYNGTTVLGNYVTQLFFDDSITDTVFQSAPYNTRNARDTRNAADMIYTGAQNASRALLTLIKTDTGYAASINVGVNIAAGTAAASTTTSYALPQAVFGGGWYTGIYLANTTAVAASVALNFIDASGLPLSVTLPGLGAASTQDIALAPRATALVELPDSGELTQGWVEALLPVGVIGYGVFRQSVTGRADQEAVVPLAPETSTTVQVVFDDVNFTTALALVNPTSQTITVTITAYSATGSQLGTGTVTLAPRSKAAVTLHNLSGLSGVSGSRGWVSITSSPGAVAALGLRFAAEAFTSIPANHT